MPRNHLRRLIITAPVWLLGIPAAHGASVECARATTAAERAVCADPRLSALDDALGRAHAEARARTGRQDRAALRIAAGRILDARHACGATTACLVASYASGLATYAEFGSSVPLPGWINALAMVDPAPAETSSLPAAPGRCVVTRIKAIEARLEGEPPGSFESGTGVTFNNGGYQVSYDKEADVIASHPGDRAVMCLLSVPVGCPRGDPRGRSYMVTNTRTGGTWTLPDSEHRCGGA